MNRQEIYNKVKNHLLTQNKKSCDENFHCVYRNPDGLKCALGCLISDEYYSPEIEHNNIDSPKVINALQMSGVKCTTSGDFNFLGSLQNVHDSKYVDNWEKELYNIAKDYNLIP